MKRMPYVQGLVWAVILFVLPLPLIQTLANGLPAIYNQEALAIQVGSIAYVWFLASIYLSTRPKWLDRLIGLPSIYFIHGMLSIFAIGLAYLHKSGTQSTGLIKLTGDWAFDLFIGLMLYSLIFMAGWLTNHIPLLAQIKRTLEHLFKHELSVWLHRLNLLAVVLVFIHVQLISYITSIHPYMWLFNSYSLLTLILYVGNKIRLAYYVPNGKLTQRRQLADDFYEFTIQLRHPGRLKVQAGDYLFINFPQVPQLKERHPFSVVNNVGTDGKIILAIRGDGDFTRQIQTLPLGTKVTIDGSYGRFDQLIQDHPDTPLVLIGGGSGVVPMLALIDAYPERPITLYYSAHRQSQLIYLTELQTLAAERANFTLYAQEGRFQPTEQLTQLTQPKASVYLISGPYQLGNSWQHALGERQIPRNQIYYEEFSW